MGSYFRLPGPPFEQLGVRLVFAYLSNQLLWNACGSAKTPPTATMRRRLLIINQDSGRKGRIVIVLTQVPVVEISRPSTIRYAGISFSGGIMASTKFTHIGRTIDSKQIVRIHDFVFKTSQIVSNVAFNYLGGGVKIYRKINGRTFTLTKVA